MTSGTGSGAEEKKGQALECTGAVSSPGAGTGAALKGRLAVEARALGFARLGVAAAGALGDEGRKLRAWLAQGRHGVLGYMERTAEVRIDPTHVGMLSEARSIVVLATPYGAVPGPDLGPGRIARYARGRDYHNVLYRRLRKLARLLRAEGYVVRAAVDSMPVFERAWAQRAGLGFVGKNCCLIVPGLGSHLFLSALVTTAELPPDAPMTPRCGRCTACLQGCPTAAFAGPGQLDARRCISYHTIEHQDTVPEALRPGMNDWLFGCDACQDVCPYNHSARLPEGDEAFAGSSPLTSAAELLQLTDEGVAARFAGSPLRRAGRVGLARNAAHVLGNRGSRRHLPLLQQSAASDPSPVVRESARWAVGRIELRSSAGGALPEELHEGAAERRGQGGVVVSGLQDVKCSDGRKDDPPGDTL